MTEPAPPDLTPAEALLLMDPGGASGTRLFKITLVALLLQRVLRIEVREVRGWFRTVTAVHLWVDDPPGMLPPHVASAVRVVRSVKGGTMKQVAAEAALAYGAGLDGFKRDQVRPALVGRGYLKAVPKRFLLFRWTATTLAPAGQVALAGLRARLDQARTIPHDLENNPSQAAMATVALGPLILLLDELRPYLKGLAHALRPPGDGGDAAVDTSSESSSPHHSCHDAIDFGGLDAGSVLLLDGAMPTFDAGFPHDGGGDGGHGGSDGGGSDGGGH